MTPTFTEREQLLIDEAVRTRGDIVKPPWMQPSRLRTLNRELERIRATMPASSTRTSEPIGLYHAERRVKWRGNFAIHQAGGDGLPICPQRSRGFEDPKNADDIERPGPGPVTCWHCEQAR